MLNRVEFVLSIAARDGLGTLWPETLKQKKTKNAISLDVLPENQNVVPYSRRWQQGLSTVLTWSGNVFELGKGITRMGNILGGAKLRVSLVHSPSKRPLDPRHRRLETANAFSISDGFNENKCYLWVTMRHTSLRKERMYVCIGNKTFNFRTRSNIICQCLYSIALKTPLPLG